MIPFDGTARFAWTAVANTERQQEIASEADLRRLFRRRSSVAMLRALVGNQRGRAFPTRMFGDDRTSLPPFASTAMADMATRFSNPYRGRPVSENDFNNIVNHLMSYLTHDPVAIHPDGQQPSSEELLRMLLRMGFTQFQFNTDALVSFTRPVALFCGAASKVAARTRVPAFDFRDEYRKATGLDFAAVLATLWLAYAITNRHENGYTREPFARMATLTPVLSPPGVVEAALEYLSMGPSKARAVHKRFRNVDRTLQMYDLSPIYVHPIIRQFDTSSSTPAKHDEMLAPVPEAIPYRASDGIYFEMLAAYRTRFTDWFGHVFEEYVGDLIHRADPNQLVLSEDDVRRTYPTARGKVADWTIRFGDVVAIVECKATRLARGAVFGAVEYDEIVGYQQATAGLQQLEEYRAAILRREPGLEALHGCGRVLPIVVTLDRMWNLGSNRDEELPASQVLFKNKLYLPTGFRWEVMPVVTFERLTARAKEQSLCSVLAEMFDDSALAREANVRSNINGLHRDYLPKFLDLIGLDPEVLMRQHGVSVGTL